tara:strand:- start:25 stop:360 length:336 start_codon:yes stop_codon:yes gene_type:complete
MNPGEFRHKTTVSIKGATQQTDFGDFQQSSSTDYTRFAKVKWLPGSEKVESDVVSLTRNVEFTYRFESLSEDLDRIDTITYNSEVFYLTSIQFKGHANQQYVIIKGHTATD